MKRFGIAGSGKGSDGSNSAVTDLIVASIHKGAPDVRRLFFSSCAAKPALLYLYSVHIPHSLR